MVVIAGGTAIGALGECLAGEIPQSAGWSSSIGIGILVLKAQIRLLGIHHRSRGEGGRAIRRAGEEGHHGIQVFGAIDSLIQVGAHSPPSCCSGRTGYGDRPCPGGSQRQRW